jgi:hypothetical protein
MPDIRDTAYPEPKSAPPAQESWRKCIRRTLLNSFGGKEDQGTGATSGSSGVAQDLSMARILCVVVGRACRLASKTLQPSRFKSIASV